MPFLDVRFEIITCNTAAGVIGEEFKIEESTAAAREARENVFPSALLFVAVCELDVHMLEGD